MDRKIALEGTVNTRDLGGLNADSGPIRRGAFLRSDALHTLTSVDQQVLLDLGITDVVDLRDPAEAERGGLDKVPEGITVHAMPVVERTNAPRDFMPPDMGTAYALLLMVAGPKFVDVLKVIANSPGGVLFHCSAGKDRAGLTAALLLSALGVAREDVLADYELTQAALPFLNAAVKAYGGPLPEGAMRADGEFMATALESLDARCGGPMAYLLESGLDEKTLGLLRAKAGLA